MTRITVARGKMFAKGVANAKKLGGTFDGRTWTLPDTASVQAMLRAPSAYGWRVVASPQPSTAPGVCLHCHTYCDGDCRG